MIIVAGHLIVDPAHREAYLADCVPTVEHARATVGCLDFCLSPDIVNPARINIHERWQTQKAVEAFRGDGPSGQQQAAILSASVAEYDTTIMRRLS